MRADLSRMIKNWELSGQGDGTLTNESALDDGSTDDDDATEGGTTPVAEASPTAKPSFGELSNRTAAAMECRGNFLGGKPSYLLIFWELADKYQLLDSTLQRLDRAAVAGADEVLPVYNIRRPSPGESDSNVDSTATLSMFSSEFHTQARLTNTINRRSDLIDQLRSYRVSLHRAAADDVEKKFWENEIVVLEKEIAANDAEQRRIERKINNNSY